MTKIKERKKKNKRASIVKPILFTAGCGLAVFFTGKTWINYANSRSEETYPVYTDED